MNQIARGFIGLISAQAFLFGTLFAQEANIAGPLASPLTGSQENPVENQYALTGFDLKARRLPPHYKGHEIVQVSRILQARGERNEKAEFETTEQWQQRLKAEEAEPILGLMPLSGVYAFSLEEVLNDVIYDADKGTFDVYIHTSYAPWQPFSVAQYTLSVARTSTDSQYPGSNAFGATVMVEGTASTIYEAIVSNPQSFPTISRKKKYVVKTSDSLNATGVDNLLKTSSEWIHAAFIAPVKEAPAIKQNIRVVAVCKLKLPFYRTISESSRATISLPYASSWTMKYLTVDLIELWIYDVSSGEVYVKIVPAT